MKTRAQMTDEEINLMIEMQPFIWKSYKFMLTDIERRAMETGGGNLSPEMQLAINNGEYLNKIVEG